ncbi:MAG: aryl-alcohol dehydrogenase-like predicted oxidoreductase [Flavobacteriaceae bacterium]|jgi:aryl-alcohol dehydrogenase-like predicted oxidoreductase|uniref:aldo/keto reductase n=1 Tax=Candidatus Marifrigoribacter sp. Uisw_064 TaxID=3230970 RepID=UPI003AE8F861
MNYKKIPNTSLNVSEICLGTMTWGEQNDEKEGHEQLDYALEEGVNFIDTAEMYAVPASPLTQGKTEEIIGTWFAQKKNRDQVILATKVAGPSRGFQHIREQLDFSAASLEHALNHSLKRLQTDYIDLYQLHWPERNVNIFGVRDYNYNVNEQWEDNIAAIIERLEIFVKQGKIKHIALSNETPFGLMRYMEEHRKGAMKMVSVQNAYSLLNRRDEIALTEVLHKENLGYLPYSPLAFGQLSGKYLHGATPENARVTLFPNYSRYHGKASFEATMKYNDLANKHGLSLTQMSLAFVRQQPFVTSTIIGATTMDQLSENIGSMNVILSEEILNEINDIHSQIPNPAP